MGLVSLVARKIPQAPNFLTSRLIYVQISVMLHVFQIIEIQMLSIGVADYSQFMA